MSAANTLHARPIRDTRSWPLRPPRPFQAVAEQATERALVLQRGQSNLPFPRFLPTRLQRLLADTVPRWPTTRAARLRTLRRFQSSRVAVLARPAGAAPVQVTPGTSVKAPWVFGTSFTRARREECSGAFNTPISIGLVGQETTTTPPLSSGHTLLTTWCGPLSATTSPSRYGAVPSTPETKKGAVPCGPAPLSVGMKAALLLIPATTILPILAVVAMQIPATASPSQFRAHSRFACSSGVSPSSLASIFPSRLRTGVSLLSHC